MKTFKQFDFIISMLLIIFFTVYTLIDTETFFIGYFFVGGWQIISMAVHWISGDFITKGNSRQHYHRIVLVLFAAAGVLWIFYFLNSVIAIAGMYFLLLLLFISPVMAIVYTAMCYKEFVALKHRQLIHLR